MALVYTFDSESANTASGIISINTHFGVLACLIWGKDDGELIDYLPIKYLPLQNGKGEYKVGNIQIPKNATKLIAQVLDANMELTERMVFEIPSEKRSDTGTPLYSFYAISDIHAVSKKTKKHFNRIKAFHDIDSNHPAFILCAGDISNGTQPLEFALVRQAVESYLSDIPFIATLGNHDYFANEPNDIPSPESREAFMKWMYSRLNIKSVPNENHHYFSTRINGIHILGLDCVYDEKNFSVGSEQLEWLDDELMQSDNERFRIILNHFPLGNRILGSRPTLGRTFLRDGKYLQSIMNTHKNIIYISGHTHNRLDSDYASAEQDSENNIIYINAGSLGNTQPCAFDSKPLKHFRKLTNRIEGHFHSRSMGQIIEIYEDFIVVRGKDFLESKFVPRCLFQFF